jgi:hypothetical protein
VVECRYPIEIFKRSFKLKDAFYLIYDTDFNVSNHCDSIICVLSGRNSVPVFALVAKTLLRKTDLKQAARIAAIFFVTDL